MKVLILNGSPHPNGNTATAIAELVKTFADEGIETEVCQIGSKNIRGCIACGKCAELGRCVFEDTVNEIAPKFEQADGLITGENICIDGGMTKQMIYHGDHGWSLDV